jgi:hypothetical protein
MKNLHKDNALIQYVSLLLQIFFILRKISYLLNMFLFSVHRPISITLEDCLQQIFNKIMIFLMNVNLSLHLS